MRWKLSAGPIRSFVPINAASVTTINQKGWKPITCAMNNIISARTGAFWFELNTTEKSKSTMISWKTKVLVISTSTCTHQRRRSSLLLLWAGYANFDKNWFCQVKRYLKNSLTFRKKKESCPIHGLRFLAFATYQWALCHWQRRFEPREQNPYFIDMEFRHPGQRSPEILSANGRALMLLARHAFPKSDPTITMNGGLAPTDGINWRLHCWMRAMRSVAFLKHCSTRFAPEGVMENPARTLAGDGFEVCAGQNGFKKKTCWPKNQTA